MARKKAGGANREALVAVVGEAFEHIRELENEREQVNASIAEQYARLKRMGLSVKAARASLARYKLEIEQREMWDNTFDLTSEALGVGIEFQPDFFDDTELFNPAAADAADGDPPDNEDGDGEEVHLSQEELDLAAQTLGQPGDGSNADLGKGLNHDDDEQAEGENVLDDLSPETKAAQAEALAKLN
jgi:uncharacterized protein (UPF0335 family)